MTVEGIVLEALPGATFKVKLEDEREILAYVAGKMRVRRIRVLPGDKVKVKLTSPNAMLGRITWRM